MTHTQVLKRVLERLGFVHVAGWVRKEDAPAIRRKIAAVKDVVEAAKRLERTTNETGNRQTDCQNDN